MEAVQVAEGASGYKMRVDATLNVIQQRDPGILTVKKVDFIVFIAQVINCTGQTKQSKKLEIIEKAAKIFWDHQDFMAET